MDHQVGALVPAQLREHRPRLVEQQAHGADELLILLGVRDPDQAMASVPYHLDRLRAR
ncbi:hypothetical protein [Planobispora longispora]|uniref:hypothetical protein n=1 Tax=Planobispora longispora TaxID=28887 RepID=UPI0019409E54|nr:hypothetical protein [Planobispora longispora]BFE79786.1 hypothetical protein GCM10020093_023870 [Planobispora longispora]